MKMQIDMIRVTGFGSDLLPKRQELSHMFDLEKVPLLILTLTHPTLTSQYHMK